MLFNLDGFLKRKPVALYSDGTEIMHRLCTPRNAGMIGRMKIIIPVIYFA